MKKLILTAVSAFALLILSFPALACDGDKDKMKADKGSQTSTQSSPAAQREDKSKANQKS